MLMFSVGCCCQGGSSGCTGSPSVCLYVDDCYSVISHGSEETPRPGGVDVDLYKILNTSTTGTVFIDSFTTDSNGCVKINFGPSGSGSYVASSNFLPYYPTWQGSPTRTLNCNANCTGCSPSPPFGSWNITLVEQGQNSLVCGCGCRKTWPFTLFLTNKWGTATLNLVNSPSGAEQFWEGCQVIEMDEVATKVCGGLAAEWGPGSISVGWRFRSLPGQVYSCSVEGYGFRQIRKFRPQFDTSGNPYPYGCAPGNIIQPLPCTSDPTRNLFLATNVECLPTSECPCNQNVLPCSSNPSQPCCPGSDFCSVSHPFNANPVQASSATPPSSNCSIPSFTGTYYFLGGLDSAPNVGFCDWWESTNFTVTP